jgi:hypothetical protein
MNTWKAITLAAVGMMTLMGPADAASRAQAPKNDSVEVQGTIYVTRVESFRKSLTPAQRSQLVTAAEGWRALQNRQTEMDRQIQADVSRILTPAQAREFYALANGDIAAGGHYAKVLCVLNSATGLLFSFVGVVGCPTETANISLYYSYAAFIYANTCVLNQETTCQTAIDASATSAAGWESMMTTCDVADTAYYTMAFTYVACGGTWESEQEPPALR